MAARISRSLPQVNRRVFTGLSSRAISRVASASARTGLVVHRNSWNLAPWSSRVTQAKIARYLHTDSDSPVKPNAGILDVTAYEGSSITKKHWMSQDSPVGTVLLVTAPLSR